MKNKFFGFEKQGVDEDKKLKDFLKIIIEDAHEIMSAERSDAYPYEFESCVDEIQYKSRSGFIPSSYNRGGFSVKVFETVSGIEGSGSFPSSEAAAEQIREASELNFKFALESLELTEEQFTEKQKTNPEIGEKVWEAAHENGCDDTIMFEVSVMYHGKERGVHSATVTVNINWEFPYHRSSAAVARCLGRSVGPTEDFIETEIKWRTNRGGRIKFLKAIKAGVKKLF